MPVDKFGRHFLKTSPYKITSDTVSIPKSKPFYIWEPKNQYSKCVIGISSAATNSKSHVNSEFIYFLKNQKNYYQFPVGGKIENFEMFPLQTKIKLNDSENFVTGGSFIGQQVNKGDKLTFIAKDSKDSNKPLYIEIVLQCPVSNE